ncbi:crotonase/enoyl-CoA hydratase family protein [Rhodococcus sp. H29-C3]|uniref:crotonase/enoyl-CoA hydratase family protein n=1 Tax=Rhodococcus sp. H29-C3 TaxID=3046307 RepID=UPI0024BB7771|nr:crotonase/enoyl-CoA hydratase family protein [Rhodococcus sp. H29-C3]MDJ0359771.1 crotonase/enoyl-CoA hydratase family protein [Rhodococcus sp. H29-C3]
MADQVLVDVIDGVQIITIDRPNSRNAIDMKTAKAIGAAMQELDKRDDLRACVLTGTGSVFCAGTDLKAFVAGEPAPVVPGRGFAGFIESPPDKPLIAAVNGFALGGGMEIVLACDLVVADETAMFGLPEVKRALLAGAGGLMRLPRRVPYQLAMEMALTGEPISAAVAKQAGLVNRLTAAGESRTVAIELGQKIAKNGPMAVRSTKEILIKSRDWSSEEEFERMWEIYAPVRSSADAYEGALAFREGRAPRWGATHQDMPAYFAHRQ